jgi:hypothetical protein
MEAAGKQGKSREIVCLGAEERCKQIFSSFAQKSQCSDLLTLTSWVWKLLHRRCGENLGYLESGNCYSSEDLEKISNFLKSKGS